MNSVRNDLIDLIIRADFSQETDFKDVLRKRLFEKKSEVLKFQRLSDDELDIVSAAGDSVLLRQQEQNIMGDKENL